MSIVTIDPETSDFFYYIEFGGRHYKLMEFAWDTSGPDQFRHIVLGANETRNFYIIGENPRDESSGPEQRLTDALGSTFVPDGVTLFEPLGGQKRVERWIQQQASMRASDPAVALTSAEEVACLIEFDETTGAEVGIFAGGMSNVDLLSPVPELNQVVMLWRAERDSSVEVGFANDVVNDVLVDRLRDPNYSTTATGAVTLDARLGGGGDVTIGDGGPDFRFIDEDYDPSADVIWDDGRIRLEGGADSPSGDSGDAVGANTDVSIVTWASIKRVNDPLASMGGSVSENRGIWPAYLVEPKTGLYGGAASTIDETIGGTLADRRSERSEVLDLTPSMYNLDVDSPNNTADQIDGVYQYFAEAVGDMISPEGSDAPVPVHPSIADKPNEKSLDGLMPPNLDAVAFEDLRPEPFPKQLEPAALRATGDSMSSADDQSVVRVGDLLSVPAIGASYDPDFVTGTPGATRLADLESAWTTMPEAMAMALGYQTRSVADVGGMNMDVFDDLTGPVSAGGPSGPALPRGSLSIDDFVPFIDRDGDGQFYAGEVDETNRDEPVGLGIPLAMELMDQFHGLPASANGPAELAPGLVNINTAPWAVLRTLPFLSPRFNDPSTIEIEFWDTGANSLGDNGLVQTDVASAIMAYRRMAPFPLAGLIGTVIDETPGLPMPSMAMDFSERQLGFDPSDPVIATPWAYASGIPGLREDNSVRDRSGVDTYAQDAPRGFRSLGELLAVRYRDPNNPAARSLHNITKLGENVGPDASTDDFQVVLEGQGYGTNAPPFGAGNQAMGIQPDGVENDLDERLAIFNAVSNIATVRSDLYAVWFVVHGYRESDVANLLPSDPLIPSASGRYLMIVDRSNVTGPGDRPEIVAFQRLPD
ncbi:MAG: hypothetical protein AAF297_11775 [Planctomycetota bacterium]